MGSANGYLLTLCFQLFTIIHASSSFEIRRNSSTLAGVQTENATQSVINITDDDSASEGTKGQTLTITIASLAVTVAIVIFICVAYKFHAIQLDAKKKEIANQLMGCRYPSQCLDESPQCPEFPKDNLQPDGDQTLPVCSGTRKSLRTLTPPLLSPPPSLGSKRGSRCSTWSNLSDQDVFVGPVPRRHSSFIL